MKQELQLHRQCEELAVRLLTEDHIAEYLTARVPLPSSAPAGAGPGESHSAVVLTSLAHAIHQRTEGNPLFMVNVVDELLAHGKIDLTTVESSTPVTIRAMIEQQLERLRDEEQCVLEVASIVGTEFSAAAIAAGADLTVEQVEQRCAALARRGQFLQTKGTTDWPDGMLTTRYSFLHALYQQVTYGRLPIGRRITLHQRIGEQIEALYGERVAEIATELAEHFERGQSYFKAAR